MTASTALSRGRATGRWCCRCCAGCTGARRSLGRKSECRSGKALAPESPGRGPGVRVVFPHHLRMREPIRLLANWAVPGAVVETVLITDWRTEVTGLTTV